jgi:diaminopimelate epimerase
MKIEVTYMSGAGNLFSVVDNRKYQLPDEYYSSIAQHLCTFKIQTEGLLVLNAGQGETKYVVSYFNPDGSSGMMCGNGARCSVRFTIENKFYKNISDETIKFKMLGNIYQARNLGDTIQVIFPPPQQIIKNRSIMINDRIIPFDFVNVNSDHVLIELKSLKEFGIVDLHDESLIDLCRIIRNHEEFQPLGANVNIYNPNKEGIIELITFERGVEAITGACGTGAMSTAISSTMKYSLKSPILINPPSESKLKVYIEGSIPDSITGLILEGMAEIIEKNEIII